jgi:hypothetical protein
MTFIETLSDWWADDQWHYVSSSNVLAFRYNKQTRELTIRFHGSRDYKYFNIDAAMAEGLATASSPGGWFHANLKGAPFERV